MRIEGLRRPSGASGRWPGLDMPEIKALEAYSWGLIVVYPGHFLTDGFSRRAFCARRSRSASVTVGRKRSR
jgi:hypothetical protein